MLKLWLILTSVVFNCCVLFRFCCCCCCCGTFVFCIQKTNVPQQQQQQQNLKRTQQLNTTLVKINHNLSMKTYMSFLVCKVQHTLWALNIPYGLSPSKTICFICFKPFKSDEKCFFFQLKELFLFSRYLSFCLDFLVMYKKLLV